MRPEQLKARLRGVLAFVVTPFREDFELDLAGLEHTVERLCLSELDILVCTGGVGEFYALDLEEYRQVIRIAATAAQGRVPLVVGIGHSTRTACELARFAESAGASGLMIHPPYFVEPSLDGTYAHFESLARASRLGQIVFSTGNFVFSLEMIRRLAEIENVIGLKDEIGDLKTFVATVEALGNRMAWINGMAEPLAAAYFASGAIGFTTGLANFAPEIPLSILHAARENDVERLHRLVSTQAMPLARLRAKRKGYSIVVIKEAMNLLGLPAGPCRLPLTPLLPADREELIQILRGLRLLPA
jgi:5-dehydro-4-deoxyglucarate dehydratase